MNRNSMEVIEQSVVPWLQSPCYRIRTGCRTLVILLILLIGCTHNSNVSEENVKIDFNNKTIYITDTNYKFKVIAIDIFNRNDSLLYQFLNEDSLNKIIKFREIYSKDSISINFSQFDINSNDYKLYIFAKIAKKYDYYYCLYITHDSLLYKRIFDFQYYKK
jgi:hypothetical protein